jgi:hypothetical protein
MTEDKSIVPTFQNVGTEEEDDDGTAIVPDGTKSVFTENLLRNIQEPKWRVRTLLMKLDSDDKNGTDYFRNKFIPKVEAIFTGLPKPKDWQSFQKNDLPLLFTHSEVQQFALEHRLNKAQTKAVDALLPPGGRGLHRPGPGRCWKPLRNSTPC